LNVVFRLCVVLIPFPTKVLSQYLRSGGDYAHVAAAAYGVAMILMGISFSILNYYATARGLIAEPQKLTFWQPVLHRPPDVCRRNGSVIARCPRRPVDLCRMAFYYVIEPLMAARQKVGSL
jgi:uncharacterized membrane protein